MRKLWTQWPNNLKKSWKMLILCWNVETKLIICWNNVDYVRRFFFSTLKNSWCWKSKIRFEVLKKCWTSVEKKTKQKYFNFNLTFLKKMLKKGEKKLNQVESMHLNANGNNRASVKQLKNVLLLRKMHINVKKSCRRSIIYP